MIKNLLICPFCKFAEKRHQKYSGKMVLGEIGKKEFTVRRHSGKSVSIISNSYAVRCNNCGEIIYYKEEHEDHRYWSFRLYRKALG